MEYLEHLGSAAELVLMEYLELLDIVAHKAYLDSADLEEVVVELQLFLILQFSSIIQVHLVAVQT